MNADSDLEITDVDRDSLHILPLSILPLETMALRRARMIKNTRLESVIELFVGKDTGSGQLRIHDVPAEFAWPEGGQHGDMGILHKVGGLASYDVYSLRITLRDLEIPVNDYEALRLSEGMNRQLSAYMRDFTRPLILQIYGGEDVAIRDFDDVLQLFRSPDVQRAREKLRLMATKLGIDVLDVPKFMEDYGDVFLSLSYYRNCFKQIEPIVNQFLEAIDRLRGNMSLQHDNNLHQTMDTLERVIRKQTDVINERFTTFEDKTKTMWEEVSAERFREVEELIKSYHVIIGSVLCALTVKMDAWHERFPSHESGGPAKRSEFILTEMRQGLESIRRAGRPAAQQRGGARASA